MAVLLHDGQESYIRLRLYGPKQWLQGPAEVVFTENDPLELFPAADDPEMLSYCRVVAWILAAADGEVIPLARALEAGGKHKPARWVLEEGHGTWDPSIVSLRHPSPRLLLDHALAGREWEERVLTECADVTPITGPVPLRAVGWSGRSPLLEYLQGRTPLERRMRSVGVVLHPVLLCQQPGFRQRREQLDIQEFIPKAAVE